MVRSLFLLSAASAIAFAEETRIASGDDEDKQFWIGNRFRRPFPLRTRHKPYLPRTMQSPQAARDAADRFLFGWNQGNEAAILRLFATGAFVEDHSMLSLPVMTQFGDSKYVNDYIQFYQGRGYPFKGYKNVTAYATAMSCMTRSDVHTDEDCCKFGGQESVLSATEETGEAWWWNDFCSAELFQKTADQRNRVVETSFTATSDGFVAEYKYMLMEADCSSGEYDDYQNELRNADYDGVAIRFSEFNCYEPGYYRFRLGGQGEVTGRENFIAGYKEPEGYIYQGNQDNSEVKPDVFPRRLLGEEDSKEFTYEGVEFDFAVKATVDNYGRFRRLSVYSTAQNFYEYENTVDGQSDH